MSEYQLFCYSDSHGRDYPDSCQQKPYRVFNTQLTEEEYSKISIPKLKLEFDKNESYATRYQTAFKKAWSEATQELKQQFFDISHFDWDIFTKITGVEPETVTQPTETQEIIELNGRKYKLID
jgi:uncharacterized protein YwqG